MHQTDYVSYHSFDTMIKNDVHARRLITIIDSLKVHIFSIKISIIILRFILILAFNI
jgi:hypothetical protein